MSDLPSTPPTKTQQSVTPTPVTSGDAAPHQGADLQTTGDNTQVDPTRDVASTPAVTLSASVAGLREGSTIHGEVGKPDASGRPTLKSADASFAILSESTLNTGQSVLLVVVATEPVIRAALITVDGVKLPWAQQLQLAVTDVPPERLAARARIDAAIAQQSETDDTAPAGRDSARALFLGQTTDSADALPAFRPGSALRVEIESIDVARREDRKRPSAQAQPALMTARTETASLAVATDGSPQDKPVPVSEEPLLRPTGSNQPDAAPPISATTSTAPSDTPRRLETAQSLKPPIAAARLDKLMVPQPTTSAIADVAGVPTVAGTQATTTHAMIRLTGTVLSATVANRAVVQTPSGLFAIDAPAGIDPGAIVTFAVSAVVAGNETSATAPHLNASIAPTGLQTSAVVTGPAVIATAEAPAPAKLQPLPVGSPVVVTVLGSATPTTAPVGLSQSAGIPATPAKQPIAIADGQRRTSRATVADTAAFATESVAAHTNAATAYPEAQLGAAAAQVATESASAALTDSPAQTLTGLVVGHSISGHAVVQTPVGLLSVDGLEAVPKDTTINIEVRAHQTSSPAAATPQSTLLTFSQEWQTLKEIISVVAATDAAAAQRFVNGSTPAMNNRLASSMMFFFVAVQGGVPRTWLGDAVSKALERSGRRDLIERLGGDFSSMRRLSEERGPGDWRTFLFPFFDGKELQQLRMFTRHGDESDEDDEEGDRRRSVRFVVDVSLTKLGELQFDGLVQERRFDLIVRSKSGLADDMHQEISAIFNDGLESTSFEGNVIFEETSEFPVSPFDEVLRSTNGDQVRA